MLTRVSGLLSEHALCIHLTAKKEVHTESVQHTLTKCSTDLSDT